MGLGDLDARTDIYSLGCVLFEMLAGEPPVASMTERRVHNWAALETSRALQGAPAAVARAVKHAISRALAPLPDDRFPAVTEFAAALGAPAYRSSVPTRGIFVGRWGRKVAFALGIVVALAGVGTAARVLRRAGSQLNQHRVVVAVIENHELYLRTRNGRFDLHWVDPFGGETEEQVGEDKIVAPLPGTVVALLAEVGATLDKGAPILTLEVMKMEQTLRAPFAGVLKVIKCKVGDIVGEGVELAEIEPTAA